MLTFASLLCCATATARQSGVKPGADTTHLRQIIIYDYLHTNPDSGITVLQHVFQLCVNADWTSGAYNALNRMGIIYIAKTDNNHALECYSKSLGYSADADDSATAYYNIANLYNQQGDYPHAAENCYEAQRLAEKSTLKHAIYIRVLVYNMLSAINGVLQQDSKVMLYSKLAEQTARQYGFYEELITILNNEGGKYREHHKIDSALLCIQESLSLCEKKHLNTLLGETYEELGEVYLDSGRYEKAIEYFKQSIDPKKCSDDFYLISNYSSYGIAKALYKLKRYKEAETLLVKTIDTGKAQNIRDNLVNEYALLSDIYRATGEWQKAFYALDTAHALSDALTGSEKAAAINQMDVKYKNAEKDKELTQNKLLIAEQKNKITQERIWMLAIGGSALLLLLIGAGAYMQLVGSQRTRERENKIQVLKAVVESSDYERGRIARELHDGIGSMLGAAMLRFKAIPQENPAFAETGAYKDAMSILQDMGQEIRQAAHNLMPDILLKQPFTDAIKAYCDTIQETGTFRLDCQSFGDFEQLTNIEKLNLYRIVQELVKNAATHAAASKILVQLMHNTSGKVLTVEDNGIGFDVNNKKEGMGLPNIQTRVSSMGGQMTIESLPGKGTTIIIEIPGIMNETNS